ncbi:MAG: CDP-alcohol phosphatidyltransferase family protein [Hoeflea sp.]|nr:CDP-alcohol phosphatidyltransferase family protein [Hoeflea sp.]
MTEAAGDRRPLTSRDSRWAQAMARRMAGWSITPNQISQASMVAAALAGGCFWWAGQEAGASRVILLLAAALFCQIRLLCNLFDGMVAVEGGKASADGPFWNEFPDRVADLLIFVGAGYGVGLPELGFAAGAFAVLTAYVRELGRANGLASDFSGPMAKPHRMATLTAAAVVSIFAPLWGGRDEILVVALIAITLGAALTVLRRASRIIAGLKASKQAS